MADRQWRVQFDADVTFLNGGGIRVWEFRLDAPGPDVTDGEVAEMLVHELGLLMVDRLTVTARTTIEEPHKGLRRDAAPAPDAPRRVRGLSRTGSTECRLPAPTGEERLSGLVDLEGVLIRTTGSSRSTVDRAALLVDDVTGRAVLLHTGHAALTADSARWLVEQRAALVALDTPAAAVLGTAAAEILADASVPLVTGLIGLDRIPPRGFRLHVVPSADNPAYAEVYALTPA